MEGLGLMVCVRLGLGTEGLELMVCVRVRDGRVRVNGLR